MTDRTRKTVIVDDLLRAWEANPHLRLGQLVNNAARLVARDPFFLEDEALAEGLRALASRDTTEGDA